MTKSNSTSATVADLEKALDERVLQEWADLQKLALSAFLNGDCPEIVHMLDEGDFPTENYRKFFCAFRDHFEVFHNTDFSEINHMLAGQRWYEEIGGLKYLLTTLMLPEARMWHRGSVERLVHMLKECRAHTEIQGLRTVLEESGRGNIGEILSIIRDRAKRAEAMLPSAASLSIKDMAEDLQTRTVTRLPTGFMRMDNFLDGGIGHGAMFVLAARPGMGKTTLALNISMHAVRRKQRVLFVSLEMTREEIAERFLAGYSDSTAAEARKDAVALTTFIEGDLLIDDRTRTLDGFRSIVSRNADCDLFVLDYLQLLSTQGRDGRDMPRTQELSKMTRDIKMLARDLGKPIIVLCQMSRAIERDRGNREPVLSDLRESGSIEQDADYVTFLWDEKAKERSGQESGDEIEFSDSEQKGVKPVIFWILRKNRFGKSDTRFELDFNGAHNLFAHKVGNRKDDPTLPV